MVSCPRCSGPVSQDEIGHGENRRPVWYCHHCVEVWPLERQPIPDRERRDLA
jgi:uncharacterized protein YbaR (Trm112 family)